VKLVGIVSFASFYAACEAFWKAISNSPGNSPCLWSKGNQFRQPHQAVGFASTLWALDYMHWWATSKAAGVNSHNKQWIYTDTIVPDPNP
jgi:hypothetical protein